MNDIIFTEEPGVHNVGDIKIYALSTCAFCKKALNYLREKLICFEYIYVDDLKWGMKRELKTYLKDKYNRDVGFPFLVINDETVLVGFRENEYEANILERIDGK